MPRRSFIHSLQHTVHRGFTLAALIWGTEESEGQGWETGGGSVPHISQCECCDYDISYVWICQMNNLFLITVISITISICLKSFTVTHQQQTETSPEASSASLCKINWALTHTGHVTKYHIHHVLFIFLLERKTFFKEHNNNIIQSYIHHHWSYSMDSLILHSYTILTQ